MLNETTRDVIRLAYVGVTILIYLLNLWQNDFLFDPVAALTIIVAGYPIFMEVYRAVLAKTITMEVAMTIGIVASLAIGESLTSMVIVFFTLSAEFIEEFTVDKSRGAIKDVIALSPRKAFIKQAGDEVEVDIDTITRGDVVVIRPGERVPIDGTVVDGHAKINQAPITGESTPVEKTVGSEVFAGSIIQAGFLEVEVKKVGEDTTLGRIIQLVEEAEASKAPVQRFADRFASRFVPLVLLVATLVALVTRNITSAIAVIVVACPCAVAMATPLAVVASIGKSAKKGIIIKGGVYLEELGKTNTVVLDKTGTLTLGELQVVDVKGFEEHDAKDVLTFAAIAELHSEHHLAEAIEKKAIEYDLTIPPHQRCQLIVGKGVTCLYEETTILLGNRDLMRDYHLDIPDAVEAYMIERENEGKTAMIVVHDDHVCGVISVADVIRRETIDGLEALRRIGIDTLIMMTGDNARVANAIAEQVGIDEVMAEMLPQDKVAVVKDLVQQGKHVLMVGDGVNDAPALAEASVGVAMGAAGTDVAIETADVVLMTDDLRNIAESITVGRRAFTTIKQNIAASIIFNIVGITLASLGVLNPVVAAAFHALPDIVLFLNSSRLLT